MRRADLTVAPCINASRHTNSECGLTLLTFQASGFFTRLMEAPGASMKAHLQTHEPEAYISFLVSKTPIIQETDQNYGQFKSDVRSNIAALTADLMREYSHQLAHHQYGPINCRAPYKMPQLGREHYSLILSGRSAYQAKGLSILRPEFHNAFCQTRNLAAWARVGAVPMTRQEMRHVSVRSEVLHEETCVLVENFDPFCIFYYKSATMLDVKHQSNMGCTMRIFQCHQIQEEVGIVGDRFQ
jgi:hypothetical protein